MTELADLLVAQTEEEILDDLIADCQARGLPTTDWNSGAPERTILAVVAKAIAEKDAAVLPKLAASGFLDLCSGDWLTFVAYRVYGLTRTAAQYNRQTIRLTCAAGAGPHTVAAGDVWARTATDLRFVNVEAGTIPSGDDVDLVFQAESPGQAYNIAAGDIADALITSYPGVTADNPATTFSTVGLSGYGTGTVTPSATGSATVASYFVKITGSGQVGAAKFKWRTTGDWSAEQTTAATFAIPGHNVTIAFADGSVNPSFVLDDVYSLDAPGSPTVQQGVDEESDESLRQRCRDVWPSMAENLTDGKLRLWCRAASAQVTRVTVAAVGDGTVTGTIAGPNGGVAATTVTAVQAYVNARLDVSDSVTIASASALTINVAGTVQVPASMLVAAQAAATAAWNAYVQATDVGGVVRLNKLLEILMAAGCRDITTLTLNSVAANVTLSATQVATIGTGPASLTWTLV